VADYKKMYLSLVSDIADIIDNLQKALEKALEKAEEIYIDSDETGEDSENIDGVM
jgi:DNA-directed RNA polymerase subunit L